jgi:hypothetical protein
MATGVKGTGIVAVGDTTDIMATTTADAVESTTVVPGGRVTTITRTDLGGAVTAVVAYGVIAGVTAEAMAEALEWPEATGAARATAEMPGFTAQDTIGIMDEVGGSIAVETAGTTIGTDIGVVTGSAIGGGAGTAGGVVTGIGAITATVDITTGGITDEWRISSALV